MCFINSRSIKTSPDIRTEIFPSPSLSNHQSIPQRSAVYPPYKPRREIPAKKQTRKQSNSRLCLSIACSNSSRILFIIERYCAPHLALATAHTICSSVCTPGNSALHLPYPPLPPADVTIQIRSTCSNLQCYSVVQFLFP